MLHSKTLNVKDYEIPEFTEHAHIENMYAMLSWNSRVRYEHPHRKWEYGIVLNALRQENTVNVLDIGGSGSVFAPAATYLGMNVLQVDPAPMEHYVAMQSQALGKRLDYVKLNFFDFDTNQLFDAVVSISVIEHVPEDVEFLKRMTTFVKSKGILALTMDFHPDGVSKSQGHFRTYNKDSILKLYTEAAYDYGFRLFDDDFDYSHFETDVFDYTFASLILRRG